MPRLYTRNGFRKGDRVIITSQAWNKSRGTHSIKERGEIVGQRKSTVTVGGMQ